MKKECKKPCKCKCKDSVVVRKPLGVELPIRIGMPTIPSYVILAEDKGRIEVIFQYRNEEVRLLGDKDGIHIGAIIEVCSTLNSIAPKAKKGK